MYLRPRESLPANTRKINGVEPETRREKSESGYKLKVAHITFVSAYEDIAYTQPKLPSFIETLSF